MKICTVPDCGKRHREHGYCSGHAANWRRHGIPVLPKPTLLDRVMAKVKKETVPPAHRLDLDPCWIWTGARTAHGYGVIKRGPGLGTALVHRVTYELAVGPVPDVLTVDHLCRVRSCCNPQHLEPVTHAENVRRGISAEATRRRAAAQTHCFRGHALSGENLRISRDGKRICRTCRREGDRRRRADAKHGGEA